MATLVKTNGNFPTLFGNVFGKDFNELFAPANLTNYGVPAVNIVEGESGFRLEVAAPGLKKEDFKINLENNVLSISAQKEQKTEETTEKYTRKEFSFNSFRRSFTLPNTIDGEKIVATYTDGVLNVELPKKEEAKKTPRLIEIA
ncbi:HSP20 family protein [Runella defluvii]|uniref:HSP20 family protein n=1 Tax=Runella defluvii TaxID=370973 RepID=A0A7W6ESA9_9BACT|nr:Hsp20/alpha crystallin family protein [Runella defluvii]MBB3840433.1 HSP20 family protein [Runella defluvii]HAK78525.1 heat-shock protein Hsp20 [Runella sp.]HAO50548.1 heat-shock protein Hsp20 [Runella sp.]